MLNQAQVPYGAAIIDATGRFSIAEITETVNAVSENLERIAREIPVTVPLETMSRRLIDGDAGLVVFQDANGIAAVAVACPGLVPPPKGPYYLIAVVDVQGSVPASEAFPTLLEGWAKCSNCVGVTIAAMGEMPCPEGYDIETFEGRSVMTRHFTLN